MCLCTTESVSSADHVAAAPHRPRRRRSNRVGNRRAGGVSRPSASSTSQPENRTAEDWTPQADSLENGVVDDGASDTAKPNGAAKPQRRPRDRASDTDAVATTTKH